MEMLKVKKKPEEGEMEEEEVRKSPFDISDNPTRENLDAFIRVRTDIPRVREIVERYAPAVDNIDMKLGYLSPQQAKILLLRGRSFIKTEMNNHLHLTWRDVLDIRAGELYLESAITRGIGGHERQYLVTSRTEQVAPVAPQQRKKGLLSRMLGVFGGGGGEGDGGRG